ncbi:protein NUCLEAR FUSION DEFECTIVE 6, chloroplastic/mitochondrial-like [Heracleum sosnowskyi]|uniref:Protein NUCLEAR FUSION DEFECTIVE 6, chloroplastic/mitochondrial-like n=1 Tax=Heracleum sosnowskyi TaxID=360622 RepID=A0AAD8MNX8_9APIA|nr:protein NUCLEAR FUSION DEFECTIVE 6, chloroplastic/mitochondrial-like [Heracleum sosnowskyi]
MAFNTARKAVQKSTITSLKSLLNRTQKCSSPSLQSSHLGGFASPSPSFRRLNPLFTSRIPVELSSGIESLMPFHSATASALLTSMLSSKVGQWGTLSEGFATPL